MPKKYLVGVGEAKAFIDNNLVFVGKTLIDTSMEISTTSTDIRGGQGNGLLAQYFHDSALSVTITDAQFSLPILALNTGVTQSQMGGSIFGREEITTQGSQGTLTKVSANSIAAVNGKTKSVYFEYNGKYYSEPLTGLVFSVGDEIPSGTVLCVSYLYNNPNSETYIIPANYVPSRLHLYITVKISGDNTGEGYVGEETIEIPIFQLSGSQTLSMTADGVSNTSLTGNAIVFNDTGVCENAGHYARITETLYGTNWYDNVESLAISGGDFELVTNDTVTLKVYAIKGNTSFLADNSQLTFSSATTDTATVGANTGIVTAVAEGTSLISAKITKKPTIEASATVTVTE